MSYNFSGKVVLITGSSSGIGEGTAIYFAKNGAKVALTGRSEANLKQVASKCQQVSPNKEKAFYITGDLCIDSDIERILNETIANYKQLNVLVNNAGFGHPGSCESLAMEKYDHIMNINLRSIFYLTKLAIPYLVKTKGSIVNVSSVAGLRPYAGRAVYCLSKSALDQFTRTTALELASRQVRVNSVNPGVIETPIFQRIGMSDEKVKEFLTQASKTHALGRHGQVEEVASAIAYLASDSASFITGVSLPVDGGRHIMGPSEG